MELLLAMIPGILSALIGSYAGFRLSTRAAREAEARSIRREAAADLSAPVRDLRSMIRRQGQGDLSPAEVASVVVAWSEAFEWQTHRLPDKWRHVGRSVRAASGEVFGGVAMADILPEMSRFPLAEPNPRWQTFADGYLSYVLNLIARWGDGQSSAAALLDFDAWLGVTARRG